MTKKLTITVSDEVYEGLHRRIGPRRISRFINELARYHVLERPTTFRGSLADAYRAMAADEEAERAARDWTEGLIGKTLPNEDFSDWPGYPSR
jgi:predicted CopG family antitoxin